MANDDWQRSTEGDLDPDLAEEGEYSDWDPPARGRWRWAYRLLLLTVLVTIVASTLLMVRW